MINAYGQTLKIMFWQCMEIRCNVKLPINQFSNLEHKFMWMLNISHIPSVDTFLITASKFSGFFHCPPEEIVEALYECYDTCTKNKIQCSYQIAQQTKQSIHLLMCNDLQIGKLYVKKPIMINTVSDVYMDSKRYNAANYLCHLDQLIYNLPVYINTYIIYVYMN